MAVIGKIREKSGLLLVIIGLALFAFVMGDLFKSLGRGSDFDPTQVAVINDEKVSSQDFSTRVSEQLEIMKQQLKKSDLTTDETYQNVLSVWNTVKRETILRQEFIKLGLLQSEGDKTIPEVTDAEYMDNINGENPNPEIVRNFSDPKTGQFNPKQIEQFLSYLEQGVKSQDPKEREQAMNSAQQWKMLTKYIKEDLLIQKYNNLISKAYYLPKALAQVVFDENNKQKTVAYFGARYNIIKDDEAKPTDADYKTYYEEHKNEFKSKEEKRKLDYIVWDVKPTPGDISDLQKQIAGYASDLKTSEINNVPYIVNGVGDNAYDSTWMKKGVLSPFIDSAAFTSAVGTILGPWTENGAFHVARIMAKENRPDSLKASHILISFKGAYGAGESVTRTKEQAKILADSIKGAILKNKSEFANLVKRSDDPSAKENNGEFKWFADGSMVPEFNNACVKGNKGDIVVVESTFGYHVIRIDDKKDPTTKIRIAKIDLPITYSQETFNNVFAIATKFNAMNQTYKAFDTASVTMGLNQIKGDYITSSAAGITGLHNSRDLVKWLFNEKTKKGSVSSVYDFDNKIVVAAVNDITPIGIPTLEQVKEYITPLVIRDVKARILTEKIKGVNDLNMAKDFQSKVDTTTVSFATYSLQFYGPENTVLGTMSNSEVNKLVGPIKGEQGIFFFKVLSETKEPADKNITPYQTSNYNAFMQRTNNSAYMALEDNANIKDFLSFFY